jgi:hypothetical protein
VHRRHDDGELGLKGDGSVAREKTIRREDYNKDDNYP